MLHFRRLGPLACAFVFASTAAAGTPDLSSRYFRAGQAADVRTATSGGAALLGGAVDVDPAVAWLCARGGNGDFLVIRATGDDEYNGYVRGVCPDLNSVATLIVDSVEFADSDFVRETIANAEIIFLSGGDQSNYVRYWTGTAVQEELNRHVARGAPIGGTSAGLAVQTEFVYSAMDKDGVTSAEALADPYHPYVTLARDLLQIPALRGTIGETHFVPRNRLGRTLAFLCRAHAAGWSPAPRAIAVDEGGAVLVEPGGLATVTGTGSAYFIAAPGAPETCRPGMPLTYRNVAVRKVAPGGTFDVAAWRGETVVAYTVTAEAGVVTSTQPGGSLY